MFQKFPKDIWRPAKVVEKIKDRSYSINSSDGVYYRRNRVHLRPTKINVQIYESIPSKPLVERETTREQSNANSLKDTPVNPSIPVMPVPETSESEQANEIPDVPSIAKSRPKRTIREPAYLKDYIRPH